MNLSKVLNAISYVVLAVVLAYLILSLLGYVKIPWATVGGFSMEPTFETGTLVILCPVPSNASQLLNHIVVYDHYGEYIIHRVIDVYNSSGTYYVVTKGDANTVPDPWTTPLSEVYGVVCFGTQYLGLITLVLRKPATLILGIVVIVVLWLVLNEADSRLKNK